MEAPYWLMRSGLSSTHTESGRGAGGEMINQPVLRQRPVDRRAVHRHRAHVATGRDQELPGKGGMFFQGLGPVRHAAERIRRIGAIE